MGFLPPSWEQACRSSKPFPCQSLYPAKPHSIPLQKVEEKLEYWADKHENDTDAKDKEINALKESRAENLEMLQRFASEVRQQQQHSAHPRKTASCLFHAVIQIMNKGHGEKTAVLKY